MVQIIQMADTKHRIDTGILKNAFICIFFLTAINAIYNSISVALGGDPLSATFLMLPVDIFGDYFKAIFSFATPGEFNVSIPGFLKLTSVLSDYLNHNSYLLIDVKTGLPGNLHGMPFSTLIGLINLSLMKWIHPFYLFCLFLLIIIIFYWVFSWFAVRERLASIYLFSSIIFSYPMLFMFVRGHVLSGLTTLAILFYLMALIQRRMNFALLLLAFACSIKPNCVIFFFLIWIAGYEITYKYIVFSLMKFLLIFSLIFMICLAIDGNLYLPYTFHNFISGLQMYQANYVVGNSGLGFGSSLIGAFKMQNMYFINAEFFVLLLLMPLLFLTVWQYQSFRLTKSSFLFILCVIYCLYTPVFADYYLGIFIGPIVLMSYENTGASNQSATRALVFLCSIFALTPKNYFYSNGISYQVTLNPIVLLSGAVLVLVLALLMHPIERKPI